MDLTRTDAPKPVYVKRYSTRSGPRVAEVLDLNKAALFKRVVIVVTLGTEHYLKQCWNIAHFSSVAHIPIVMYSKV